MLHLCIVHKPHKLKVMTYVEFLRKPTALLNESEVGKHGETSVFPVEWMYLLGTGTVVLCTTCRDAQSNKGKPHCSVGVGLCNT